MADGNKFKETVESLFQGMDSVVSSKTVVGDAIHINGTIILPLVDVSFGRHPAWTGNQYPPLSIKWT